MEKRFYVKNSKFVEEINEKQESWVATHYDFMTDLKISDLVRMAGGKKSKIEE